MTTFPIPAHDPEAIALVDDTTELTWAQVGSTVAALAHRLRSACPGPDDRVAVTGENTAATLLTHAAGIAGGVGTVALSKQLTAAEMSDQLTDSGATVLVTGPAGLDAAIAATRDHPVARTVLVHGAEATAETVAWQSWAAPDVTTELPDCADRPARPMLVYTSGTTGRASASEVRWVIPRPETASEYHRTLAEARSFPTGPHIVVGPLQHNGPLTALRHLTSAGSVVVMGRFDPERFLELVERWGVTSSVMVPTHFARLAALPEDVRGSHDLSSLISVSHTGSACPPALKRRMIDWFGPVLVESYGGTELGTVTRIDSHDWLEHPGSVGRCVPGISAVVLDESRNELAPGEVGLLGFRVSPERGIRYHGDPEKTASAYLTPDVVTLGDVGYVTEDGFVHITDRQADMVVSGGVNLYPAESEAALRRHPDVVDVAVIGVPDGDLGEALLAKVISHRADLTDDELMRFCRDHLASYKCPRRFEFVHDLPRNAMGKFDKKTMRAPYWGGDRTIAG